VEKPFSRERILLLARNAAEAGRLKRELARLRATEVEDLLGESSVMGALREAITRVAPTDTRVLILGRAAPERSWWLARCTGSALGPDSRSSG